MDINEMTIKQFKELPTLKELKYKDIDGIVLLPTKIKHDSGFNYYSVAIVKQGKAIGKTELYDTFSIFALAKEDRIGIDCLRKSGLMRIFLYPKYTLYPDMHWIRKEK